MASLTNIWNRRQVANSSAKACMICFRPSSTVLITPDSKDFFYICDSHLKDRGFCSPIVDEAAVAARKEKEKKEKELELEKEKVKKEFEEKEKKKKEKAKEKEKDKGKEKDKDSKNSDAEKEEKAKASPKKKFSGISSEESTKAEEEIPKVYQLHKSFYQMRVDKMRANEMARRNRERLKNPSTFPSVPTGDP